MNLRTSFGVTIAAAAAMLATPLAAQQPNPAWNGLYAGLNVGGMWGTSSSDIGVNSGSGNVFGVGSGFLGGAQVGYNYLVGPAVLGAEIDFQGSTYSANVNGWAGGQSVSATQKMPWFSTMRLRAGYPVGSVMPYVTGGAVWGNRTVDGSVSNMGSYYASQNFWTWTVGGGVEGQIADKWTMKLEYLYMGTPDTPLSAPGAASFNERAVGNVVRVGANYRF